MKTSLYAAIPSPPQGVWEVGAFGLSIPIRAYAICIIIGIFVAMWIGSRRYEQRGGRKEIVYDAAIVAIPAGIIGGRAYHVLTDHQKYFCSDCNPLEVFAITKGGLGIWGAVLLGTICIWLYLRFRGVPFLPFADSLAPGVVLAQAIGRLGNWFNQELYGAETDVPWALELYYRVDDAGKYAPLTGHSTGEIMATVHPTFLYELLINVAIFVVLINLDRVRNLGHGRVFALYVALYTFGRFFVEGMRTDEATMVMGMRINEIVALVVCAIAVLFFLRLPKGRETPEEVLPQQSAEKAVV